jgi:hypothetical protein
MAHFFSRYVPAHFHHPVQLARRLVRTGDRAALQAMAFAALSVVTTPLDLALAPVERRLGARPRNKTHPVILVCGPPRAGTTVVYQALVSSLPVAYLSNVVTMFPRAPLVASKWSGLARADAPHDLHSYYGKTSGLRGTCDALGIWDNWFGDDRTRPNMAPSEAQRAAMRQFFIAADEVFGRPLCCKNNGLNVLAHLVAESVPQAMFICLTRRSAALAASLYRARSDIHGGLSQAYGLTAASVDPTFVEPSDPVESVIAQVRFFERVAAEQQARLGLERFWRVSYEEFCQRPRELVERAAQRLFGSADVIRAEVPEELEPPKRREIPSEVKERFAAVFE